MKKNDSKGSVLLEFAFTVPVMILMILFIQDALYFYHISHKAQHSAYIAAQLLQNVSINRSNKRLTTKDLQQITYASCINSFPGKTMFQPSPFGCSYEIYYEYAKRINENQYTYWVKVFSTAGRATSPNTLYVGGSGGSTKTLAQLKAIYSGAPSLVCNRDGEEKVRLHVNFIRSPSTPNPNNYKFFYLLSDKRGGTNVGPKSPWLVFSPKSGIFPVQ